MVAKRKKALKPKKVVKLRKDKKGRFIRHKKKKIYLKGSLDSIKRYIKRLFEKERVLPSITYAQPETRFLPTEAIKGEEVAVESNLLNELLQKSKADMVNIAKDFKIKNISGLSKSILAEQIINAGWTPKFKIPQPTVETRGRKPQKPALLERLKEFGIFPTGQKSVAQLEELLNKAEEEAKKPEEEKPKPRGRVIRKPKPEEVIPEIQDVKTEEVQIAPPENEGYLSRLTRTISGAKPQTITIKKSYEIPFMENPLYYKLLTGSKNPAFEEIENDRVKYLNISKTGEVTYVMPKRINSVQISALLKILNIPKPEKTASNILSSLIENALDRGVLDPENVEIRAEAQGVQAPEQLKVNLEDEPIEQSQPPPPIPEAQIQGQGKYSAEDGISNFKIDELMSKFPHYLGTIGKDQVLTQILPKVKEHSKGGFIINTDPINKKGEHWQACYFDGTPNGEYEINFFDSYADEPNERMMSDLKQISEKLNCKLLLKFKQNRIALQNERSSNCGWFCIRFLTDRFRGKPFRDASGFSDVMKGERDIKKFKEQHGGFVQYLPSFGKLIPEKVKQFVKEKLFFPPNRLPPSAQKVLDSYKDAEITGISVQREPVNGMITKFLNFISLGKFGEIQKKLGYDRFYHLSMNVATTKGRLKIEKNARINIVPVKGIAMDNYGVPNVPKGLTVGEMLEKARRAMNDTEFFQYDALSRNCQKFILGILKANIPSLSKDLVDFIYQPVEELVKGLPEYVQKIARFATDTGAKAQQLIEGGKIRIRIKNATC